MQFNEILTRFTDDNINLVRDFYSVLNGFNNENVKSTENYIHLIVYFC